MANEGKIQLIFTITAPPELVEEGDRIFRSHAPWIESTHHRTGDKALLSYNVSKAPELKNPLDPSAGVTGSTCFVLNEIYESEAGIADHFAQAQSSWKDFAAFVAWMGKCKTAVVPSAKIVNSLW
ncbi:MAG: hypothetical protein O2930_14980 [Acidobacteria bacterium]|nr:hypothetical protein [Acidobacteriota bacterium]